jgi:MFS family permease
MTLRQTTKQRSAGYRYFIAGMLAFAYILNALDRQIVAVLGRHISNDLHLTKTEFGLLGGTAFAVFYTVCGVPVAWMSERRNRAHVIALACAVWSVFTALCGMTKDVVQIALCRMGVGLGEAGGSPPSYSLISDYFPPSERATALAIYSLGYPLGSMLGVFLGGRIADTLGWRAAFYILGAPGVVVALLLFLTVEDPRRSGRTRRSDDTYRESQPSLRLSIMSCLSNRTMLVTGLTSGLSAFVLYAILIWNPQFLELAKGMSGTDVANIYSAVLGIAGVAGIIAGGWLADRLGRSDQRWFAWLPAIASLLAIPFWIVMLHSSTWQVTMACLAVTLVLLHVYLAPCLALVQNTAAPVLRAVSGAVLLLMLNLVGLGLGPVYVGRIADAMDSTYGHNALAVSYYALIPVMVLAAGAYIFASFTIDRNPRAVSLSPTQ